MCEGFKYGKKRQEGRPDETCGQPSMLCDLQARSPKGENLTF